MRGLLAVLTLALLVDKSLAEPQKAEPAKPVALAHVTVIDGTGAAARPDMTVVIDGSRITALAKSTSISLPQGAQTVDGTGKVVIPGLWDMHVHIVGPSYLPLFLANGVTGVREMHAFFKQCSARVAAALVRTRRGGP
jgi:predicted amidohydrolase YtcJ